MFRIMFLKAIKHTFLWDYRHYKPRRMLVEHCYIVTVTITVAIFIISASVTVRFAIAIVIAIVRYRYC